MIIYKITNNINNKAYVGLTTQPNYKARWTSHRCRSKNPTSNSIIHKDINKYGIDNFTFEVINCTFHGYNVSYRRDL